MQSVLIVGGNFQKRKEEIKKLTGNQKVSQIDLFTLKENGSIGIEKIRELTRWSFQKPYAGKTKVAIIPAAEKLTLAAQNALLKLLEEPPQNTLIILAAPQKELLLPTIVSRCRIIKLKTESEITLSSQETTQMTKLFNTLLGGGVGERIKKGQEIAKTREETIVFLNKLLFFLRKLLLSKFSTPHSQTSSIAVLYNRLTSEQIVKILKELLKTKKMVEKNVNFKLALENFFLDLPSLRC